jgi:hypothetical protein
MCPALNFWQRKHPLFRLSFSRISSVSLGRALTGDDEREVLGDPEREEDRPRKGVLGRGRELTPAEPSYMGSSERLSREERGFAAGVG